MERDEKLEKALSRFVDYFELVFDQDWDHTKACLQNPDTYIDPAGTFVNPLEDDEANNWGNRKALLEAYRDVVELMMARRIYGSHLDDELGPPV
jgi:hypothetical protein